MSQLDDRDQLARRVAYLQKQEEKLVLRCGTQGGEARPLRERGAQGGHEKHACMHR